ncbi:MAG TPA: hypothetical protein VHV10_18015 [Ktedonobacteraceae bacterium]|nr:hypothetical protein [Ktedonobacteraceae bacterium]
MSQRLTNSAIEPRLEMEKRRLSGESDNVAQGIGARETEQETGGMQPGQFMQG